MSEKNQGQSANNAVANKEQSMSERFSAAVIKEFGSNVATLNDIPDYQKNLIQGYFVNCDRALLAAEQKRASSNYELEKKKPPYKWENVDMKALAVDLMHCSKIGLDMNQPNHLFPIPYLNKRTNKYDFTLMKGYNGIRYLAEKYAMDMPKATITELVYSNDVFKPIKKSASNPVESYDFEIPNPFDRGNIVGGFGYIAYAEPEKNTLIIMSIADILKRKPKNASAEFWGGEKDVWKDGKKVGKEATDGWYEEMCLKTLKREVYGTKNITLDPMKIDETYMHIKNRELEYAELEAQAEITENANSIDIEAEANEPVNEPKPDVAEAQYQDVKEEASEPIDEAVQLGIGF